MSMQQERRDAKIRYFDHVCGEHHRMFCDSSLEGVEISSSFNVVPVRSASLTNAPANMWTWNARKSVNQLRRPAHGTHSDTSIWRETFIVVVSFCSRHGGLITTGNAGRALR